MSQLDKGLALLKSLVAPHDGRDKHDEHAWRKCRKCLAREELHHKGTDDALKAVLMAVEDLTSQLTASTAREKLAIEDRNHAVERQVALEIDQAASTARVQEVEALKAYVQHKAECESLNNGLRWEPRYKRSNALGRGWLGAWVQDASATYACSCGLTASLASLEALTAQRKVQDPA